MDDELNTGDIGVGIKGKNVQGGRAILTFSHFRSTLEQLETNELLHILHSLSNTSYTEATSRRSGFDYDFDMIFD